MDFWAGFVNTNETTQKPNYSPADVKKCTEKDFEPFVETDEEYNPEGIGLGQEEGKYFYCVNTSNGTFSHDVEARFALLATFCNEY